MSDSPEPPATRHGFSRRLQLLVWSGGILIVVVVIVAGLLLGTRERTHYEGKALSDYFKDLVRPAGSGSYIAATNALFALREEARPVAERYLAQRPPLHVRAFIKWGDKLPVSLQSRLYRQLDPNRYLNRQLGAERALRLLESFAKTGGNLPDRTTESQPAPPHADEFPEPDAVALDAEDYSEIDPDQQATFRVTIDDEQNLRLIKISGSGVWTHHSAELEKLWAHVDPRVRQATISAIGYRGGRTIDQTLQLMRLLNDDNSEVKLHAALVLATWWPKNDLLPRAVQVTVGGGPTSPPAELDRVFTNWVAVLKSGLDHRDSGMRLFVAANLVRLNQADDDLMVVLATYPKPLNLEDQERLQAWTIRNAARELRGEPPERLDGPGFRPANMPLDAGGVR
ncbi:MAG TPA: HEAT repeat domain-containing protein [Verrucomicrobiae bacterium]|nr:HEAT repeat domain-containing protein [Verrucomicrobiae bacterium]